MRTRILAAILAVGAAGCTGGVYSAEVSATTPQLVYIEPGIQVVVDSEIPIFYTDSFYWRYYDNSWYRSSYATGGWVRYERVPQHLRRIERPQQYSHYRPAPVVRDHRTPAPVVRDHRTQPTPRVQPTPPDRDPRKGPENRGKDKGKDRDKDKDKDKKSDNPHKHG